MNFVRETQLGQIARWLTHNRILLYPEEQPGFDIPRAYLDPKAIVASANAQDIRSPEVQSEPEPFEEECKSEDAIDSDMNDDTKLSGTKPQLDCATLSRITTRPDMSKITTQEDLETAYRATTLQESLKLQPSQSINPTKTSDGTILVTWYTTDDPENPQNWSFWAKSNVVFQMYQYVVVVYMGSAIYSASSPQFMEVFGVTQSVASLGLGLYVLGYGIGPLFLSPVSEIPAVGRNPPYMISFLLFVIISIPTALVNDVPGFMVLRFLQGIFGSPCIATTGASLGDISNLFHLPYLMMGWAMAGFIGPALGPIIAGFSVVVKGWHWSMWELLWASAPSFIAFLLFLPETSTPTILYRRAQRLRKLTGNPNIKAKSEIAQSMLSPSQLTYDALVVPWKINALDPAILFTSIYTGLVYAVFYSFFEVFPLVFVDIYGMNLGQMGLAFLSVTIGVALAGICTFCFLHFYVNPRMRVKGFEGPEQRLLPAVIASVIIPIGLFMFGWTSRASIHWIVPAIGAALISAGMISIINNILLYVALAYPKYSASLFAGNDVVRSTIAFAGIMWSGPLFKNLGVDKGCTLLAGLTIGCIIGIVILYVYGANLRARSKFAV
ncbi:major facilitator superfamily domain-containing protein [Paraphoma chrysanthemicola]|uniref:Major facilitator superfamily domain-containing protein n=1 Tax=Paraphoma chrysanthemicola TaxID=798071 RepID=A0A8K0R7U4_9PLEO|nr:major facilitator superfamily domain-containing protein [Paraphoma chrysanthemicola]